MLNFKRLGRAGEVNLIGRHNEPMFQFDLDLGMRVDVEKKVAPELKSLVSVNWVPQARLIVLEPTCI